MNGRCVVCRSGRSQALVHFGAKEGNIGGRRLNQHPNALVGLLGAEQDLLEGDPKVIRKQRIDQWIESRIAVAQPKEHRKEQPFDAVVAKGANQVDGKKWQPAEDKAAHNDAQRLGGLGFGAEFLHLHLDIALAHLLATAARSSCRLLATAVLTK